MASISAPNAMVDMMIHNGITRHTCVMHFALWGIICLNAILAEYDHKMLSQIVFVDKIRAFQQSNHCVILADIKEDVTCLPYGQPVVSSTTMDGRPLTLERGPQSPLLIYTSRAP